MEHKNAELEARFGSMLEENQHLARRLDQFTPASQQITPFQRETFDDQPEDIRTDQPEGGVPADSAISSFDQGFKWETRDGEYNLVFHNELQVDTRAYAQPNSYPVEQFGFFLNRGRVYFNGHMTKPVEYSISFNQGLADFQLLDVYLNFNYDPRFQVRIGRYRVPYMYEWYALSNQFLVSPERSVFALNYGYRRNEAIMLHGEVLDESMEYAVAVSTGPRNALFDTNSDKDMLAFVNYRPFQHAAATSLKNLNIGGSLGTGVQDNVPRPINFRTSLNASDSDGALQAAPIFLRFNDDVVERGLRRLWALHVAYYYEHLSLLSGWETGFNSYTDTANPTPVRLPTYGYYVQCGYFITGETVTRRTFVQPLRPFDLRPGKGKGPGAIELQARYCEFDVGQQVFNAGFADPNLWTRRVQTIDVGVNWWLNMFTKVAFDWQHAIYASPIPYRPGAFQSKTDLFWLRFQLYY